MAVKTRNKKKSTTLNEILKEIQEAQNRDKKAEIKINTLVNHEKK